MRLTLAVALLVGASLGAFAAPPKKPAKVAPSRPLPDIPPAGSPGELLDLERGRSRAIGPMLESRTDFQATAFPDGRVLVTGGSLKGGTSEWFDPATGRFSPGPAMAQPRQGHRALLLKDGRLLVLGGTEPPSPAEILVPGATRFQALPGSEKFGLSAEALELDEGVLLLDGQEGKCWTWDGTTKGPRSTGSLNRARILFRAMKLDDGRVLVSGGWPAPPASQPRRPFGARPGATKSLPPPDLPVEVFTPRKGRWSAWKAPLLPRAQHLMARLPDGRVALLGGFGSSAERAAEAVEVLDPAKESVESLGKPSWEGPSPGWASGPDGGLFLPERGTAPGRITCAAEWLRPPVRNLRLANAYLAPALVPLPGQKLLVLGSPVWGPSLERWDPRTRQSQYIGALRAGTESLVLLEGKVATLGPIVDTLDPRTGNLAPLGWREDLAATLKRIKSPLPAPAGVPPFPAGQALREYLVVGLDAQKALVVGGRSEESPEGTDQIWLWDLKRKTLLPSGNLRTKRAFPTQSPTAQGGLRLGDGSVLIWSGQ